jgi:hypothetical protein
MGLGLIYLLLSAFAYRTLRLFVSPPVAFLASLAFLSFDMTWTFNHIAGIVFLLISFFFLWKFFLTLQVRWCYFALLVLTGLALVKVSAGVTSFLAFLASLAIHFGFYRYRYSEAPLAFRHFIFIPLIFGVTVLGLYGLFYWGLPINQINECLTALPQYNPLGYQPWTNFKHLILRFLVWERSRLLGVVLFLVLGTLAGLGLRKRALPPNPREVLVPLTGSLILFALANSLDYFFQEGLIYRFDFWLFPVLVLWMGLWAEWASSLFGRKLKIFLFGLAFLGLLAHPVRYLKEALGYQVAERYLDFPRGQVYLGGDLPSVEVLKQGTRTLIENTKPTEEILALPYDPLYCFLSGRRQAVRELIFMEHSRLPDWRQEEIIQTLDARKVPLVLISNRSHSEERGMGEFGKTHCQRLAAYIDNRYREVRRIGDWEAGPHKTHAIKILLRRD